LISHGEISQEIILAAVNRSEILHAQVAQELRVAGLARFVQNLLDRAVFLKWDILSLARQEGLEPPTRGLEIRCSIQLSYCRTSM
jgi:hypothetical protein